MIEISSDTDSVQIVSESPGPAHSPDASGPSSTAQSAKVFTPTKRPPSPLVFQVSQALGCLSAGIILSILKARKMAGSFDHEIMSYIISYQVNSCFVPSIVTKVMMQDGTTPQLRPLAP